MERRLAAILAADVVNYSRLMGEDEDGTLAALKAHRRELFNPETARYKGRIVKFIGDGALVEFSSVVDAVACAIAIQRALADQPGPIVLRMGVNLGDVIVDDDDIYGDGVNVAARIEALAEPGGICISDIVHESLGNRVDAEFSDAGSHQLKNIEKPVRIWRWRDPDTPLSSPPEVTVASAADEPSIAVLPFENLSGDPEQEYFVDGITEDIILEISRFPDVLVISRNSAFTYKGKAVKVQDVCRELGVRCVLEGSVRKAGDRVRITAQLVDGRSGAQLWAERYNRRLEDVFAVQDDVTEKIVRALEMELLGTVETPKPTESLEAYDCVLRGREQYRLFTKDGNVAARDSYERAIVLDPDYAEPF
ncbi:MAG: adenylate/guanylate cyclase domain-containing protein, partial [Hyphomicrobiaceae bacterium]